MSANQQIPKKIIAIAAILIALFVIQIIVQVSLVSIIYFFSFYNASVSGDFAYIANELSALVNRYEFFYKIFI